MIVKILTWLLGLLQPKAPEAPIPAQVPDAPYDGEATTAPVPVAPPVCHASGAVRVPGKEMMLCGRMYVIAPLNAAAVKQYRDQINQVFVGGLPDIELVSKLALASLQRNYPTMTVQAVEEIIDFENYFEVWEAMLNLSGLVAQAKEMVRRVQDQMEAAGLKA